MDQHQWRRYTYPDANCYSDCDIDLDADSNSNSHIYSKSNSNSNVNGDTDSYCKTFSYAKSEPGTKASADPGSAAVAGATGLSISC
jgi:hypothetical protein